jgi:hypothetical protein
MQHRTFRKNLSICDSGLDLCRYRESLSSQRNTTFIEFHFSGRLMRSTVAGSVLLVKWNGGCHSNYGDGVWRNHSMNG